MSKPIIKVENISKCYIIGHEEQQGCSRYKKFSDVLMGPFQKKKATCAKEEFWALKDINFEVEQGDRIGIIGRNGAGKSTLLKVLSKITTPTTGRISIGGRIASLLEVGTGFHPELTGRENIYLNGAILGMKHSEIKKKFDEIVDFSGVEKFLDTPVKRYSSGMYVRLAFAVAAHLEPEILVIDEVLAVGDAEFQKKCLGKMDEISKNQGRTILFVSHNMGAVKQLCNRGFLLGGGNLVMQSDVDTAIQEYMQNNSDIKSTKRSFPPQPKKEAYISEIVILDSIHNEKYDFDVSESIFVKISIVANQDISNVSLSLIVQQNGQKIFTTWNIDAHPEWHSLSEGKHTFIVEIPPVLNKGIYWCSFDCGHPNITTIDEQNDCISFSVSFVSSDSSRLGAARGGIIIPNTNWDRLL